MSPDHDVSGAGAISAFSSRNPHIATAHPTRGRQSPLPTLALRRGRLAEQSLTDRTTKGNHDHRTDRTRGRQASREGSHRRNRRRALTVALAADDAARTVDELRRRHDPARGSPSSRYVEIAALSCGGGRGHAGSRATRELPAARHRRRGRSRSSSDERGIGSAVATIHADGLILIETDNWATLTISTSARSASPSTTYSPRRSSATPSEPARRQSEPRTATESSWQRRERSNRLSARSGPQRPSQPLRATQRLSRTS